MWSTGLRDGLVHIYMRKIEGSHKGSHCLHLLWLYGSWPSLLLCSDIVMNLFNSLGSERALQSFWRDSLPYSLH